MSHHTSHNKPGEGGKPVNIYVTLPADVNEKLAAFTKVHELRSKAVAIVHILRKQLFPPVNHAK